MKADAMAARLRRAAISQADGFSLNVSNFISTADNIRYGEQLSALMGSKHFIIDTSRNGAGGNNGEWCNPRGRALGQLPTTRTGNALVDGFLWIKQPGESDGACNGGPKAGGWWSEYALELARNQPAQFAASR
jgi:endoglucanase